MNLQLSVLIVVTSKIKSLNNLFCWFEMGDVPPHAEYTVCFNYGGQDSNQISFEIDMRKPILDK